MYNAETLEASFRLFFEAKLRANEEEFDRHEAGRVATKEMGGKTAASAGREAQDRDTQAQS